VEDPVGLGYATREEQAIADAWQRTLRHVRAGRPRAARLPYERQAEVLRALVASSMTGATVGDAAAAGLL
jgi:hypothetical protein